MFILKKGHQPGVYMPLRALFLVIIITVLLSPNNDGKPLHRLWRLVHEQIRLITLLLKILESLYFGTNFS